MKKTKKKRLLAVSALLLLAAAAVAAVVLTQLYYVPANAKYRVETAEAHEGSRIKVGIISDLQLPQADKYMESWDYPCITEGAAHFIKALKYLNERQVDMIVLNGDVVNLTRESTSYDIYNKILDDVYGKKRENMPHIIFPMGNHEHYGPYPEKMYYKHTHLPLNARTIVNGYSFISVSNTSWLQKKDREIADKYGLVPDGPYGERRLAFLREQLRAAAREDPGKPIFVFFHMPISDELVGGHWATPNFEEMYDILREYPQAVVFTSHSHYCLSDERSIVQTDFTMANTGTMSYFDFDWLGGENNVPEDVTMEELLTGDNRLLKNKDYLINPQILGINSSADVPFRNQVSSGYLLDINTAENEFTLNKVNFETGLTFGEPFTMSSFRKTDFTRTPEQLGKGAMPFFTETEIETEVNGADVRVTFSAADQTRPVKYYFYELEDESGRITPVRFFARNYILGSETPYMEQNVLYGLEKGRYELRVYAINSFGLKSETYLGASFEIL